jgi:hypothetical protein
VHTGRARGALTRQGVEAVPLAEGSAGPGLAGSIARGAHKARQQRLDMKRSAAYLARQAMPRGKAAPAGSRAPWRGEPWPGLRSLAHATEMGTDGGRGFHFSGAGGEGHCHSRRYEPPGFSALERELQHEGVGRVRAAYASRVLPRRSEAPARTACAKGLL